MQQEFLRYRLASQRMIVGALQWVAGVGLLAGMSQPWMGQAAAGGLALMMLSASRSETACCKRSPQCFIWHSTPISASRDSDPHAA